MRANWPASRRVESGFWRGFLGGVKDVLVSFAKGVEQGKLLLGIGSMRLSGVREIERHNGLSCLVVESNKHANGLSCTLLLMKFYAGDGIEVDVDVPSAELDSRPGIGKFYLFQRPIEEQFADYAVTAYGAD